MKTVAFSPDGALAASGSGLAGDDHAVRVWNVATSTQRDLLGGHDAGVMAVQFSPDGRQLLTGDAAGRVMLRNVESGELVREFASPPGALDELVFIPDGSRAVAATGPAGTVQVWEVATGKVAGSFVQGQPVYGVAVTPAGDAAAVTLKDGTVRLIDLVDGRTRRTFAPPALAGRPAAYSVAISPDGNTLAAGYKEGVIRFWNLDDGSVRHDARTLSWNNERIEFSADGRRLFVAGPNGSPESGIRGGKGGLTILDARNGVRVAGTNLAVGGGWAMAVAPDGRHVLTGGGVILQNGAKTTGDYALTLWEVPDASEAPPIPTIEELRDMSERRLGSDGDGVLFEAPIFGDGREVIVRPVRPQPSANRPGPVGHTFTRPFMIQGSRRVFQKTTGIGGGPDEAEIALVRRFPGHGAAPKGVAVSPDGKFVASGGGWPEGDDTARVWKTDSAEPVRVFPHPDSVMNVAFSPDSQRLLTACYDGKARLFEIASGETVNTFEGADQVEGVAFAPDGNTVVACSPFAAAAYVWDAETGGLRHTLTHADGQQLLRVAVTPDGARVVAVDRHARLLVWEIKTGAFVKALPEEYEPLNAGAGLAVLADGRAVCGGNDGVVRLWDLDRGEELRRVKVPFTIQSVAASPDGKTALAVGGGGAEGTPALAAVDLGAGAVTFVRAYGGGFPWDVAFHPDGRKFLICAGARWVNGDPRPTGDDSPSLWLLP